MNRDEGSKCVLNEEEDWVEIDNVMFQKPFVEKPVDAEDHNVYIYYPTGAGGGSQRLFRKVWNGQTDMIDFLIETIYRLGTSLVNTPVKCMYGKPGLLFMRILCQQMAQM